MCSDSQANVQVVKKSQNTSHELRRVSGEGEQRDRNPCKWPLGKARCELPAQSWRGIHLFLLSLSFNLVHVLKASQLPKMKKYIPFMSLP